MSVSPQPSKPNEEIDREVDREVDVVVVGAGLSGLCAARKIAEKGYALLVLEAQDRVGGRTLSVPFGKGIVELGAQWVDPQHQHILRLAQELAVESIAQYQQGKKLLGIDDTITAYRTSKPKLSFTGQIDLQWTLTRIERLSKQVPLQAPHQAHRAEEWKQMSVAEFQNEQMWSRDGRAIFDLMVQTVFALEPANISMLYFLWYLHKSGGFSRLATMRRGLHQKRFVGGAQQLAIRLAEIVQNCGQNILFNTSVSAIHQDDRRVSITSSNGRFFAKHVIIAVPPTAAKVIDFQPALPQVHAQMHSNLALSPAMKVIAIYETPFWQQQGFSGEVISHVGPLHLIYDSSDPCGNFGALSGYLFGDTARHWSGRRSEELQAVVIGELVRYFGMVAAEPVAFFHHDWSRGTNGTGGYSTYTPLGFSIPDSEQRQQPWGRIHWAGAESSHHSFGTLNGAVEAGERAAEEILVNM